MNGANEVVQRQIEAYNAHDIDAFAATYHDDVEIYDHPNTLRSTGLGALRETYGRLFEKAPDLCATITNRMALGDYVVDFETVTGLPGGKTLEAVPIYQVQDGKVRRVWFLHP